MIPEYSVTTTRVYYSSSSTALQPQLSLTGFEQTIKLCIPDTQAE